MLFYRFSYLGIDLYDDDDNVRRSKQLLERGFSMPEFFNICFRFRANGLPSLAYGIQLDGKIMAYYLKYRNGRYRRLFFSFYPGQLEVS
jgi:hypothetical protein